MSGAKFHNCSFVLGILAWAAQEGFMAIQAVRGCSLLRQQKVIIMAPIHQHVKTMDLSKHYSFEKSDLLTRQVSHHEGVSILTFFEGENYL